MQPFRGKLYVLYIKRIDSSLFSHLSWKGSQRRSAFSIFTKRNLRALEHFCHFLSWNRFVSERDHGNGGNSFRTGAHKLHFYENRRFSFFLIWVLGRSSLREKQFNQYKGAQSVVCFLRSGTICRSTWNHNIKWRAWKMKPIKTFRAYAFQIFKHMYGLYFQQYVLIYVLTTQKKKLLGTLSKVAVKIGLRTDGNG